VKNGEPNQLDLALTIMTSAFISKVGLLLTDDFGMIVAKMEPDSLVINISFKLEGMTLAAW